MFFAVPHKATRGENSEGDIWAEEQGRLRQQALLWCGAVPRGGGEVPTAGTPAKTLGKMYKKEHYEDYRGNGPDAPRTTQATLIFTSAVPSYF